MTDQYHNEDIYRTLLIGGGLTGRTKRELYERLDQYDEEFLSELNDFLYGLHLKRLYKILVNFSTSLFRMTPDEYMAWSLPYREHYLDLCGVISGSSEWASICRSLISGLKNYPSYVSGEMTPRMVRTLLQAAIILHTASYELSPENEKLYRHVEYYGSLPEGELLDLIMSHPEALSHLSALLQRGDFRIAELASVVSSDSSLVLTSGAL